MKNFKFSLQALRILRERQEQNALQEYGNTLRQLEAAQAKAEALQTELEGAWTQLQQAYKGSTSARHLAQLQEWCSTLRTQKQQSEYNLKVAHQHSQEAFTRLVAARQARSVVEKCYERQKQQHELQVRKHQTKIQDDRAAHHSSSLLMLNCKPLWN
jgi:flagellar export protein FliJ